MEKESVHPEPTGYFHAWGLQFWVLVKKNWLVSIRNRRATIIQLLSPIIFVFLLWFIQFTIENNRRNADFYSSVHHGSDHTIGSIPPCYNPDGKDCLTFTYAPVGDPDVEAVVKRIRESNDPPIPETDVKGFPSSSLMDDFLLDNQNISQGAYIFNFSMADALGRRQWGYVVQTNETSYRTHGLEISYTTYVQVPMMKAVQQAILEVLTNDPDFDLELITVKFPHPQISGSDVIKQAGPTFIFGAIMFNVIIGMGQIVLEKELKLREAMRMMGMKESVYWASWFATHAVFGTIITFLLIITGAAFQFDFFLKNAFGLYFFLLWLFVIAMIPVGYMCAAFVRKSSSATSVGFLLFLAGILCQLAASIIFGAGGDSWGPYVFSWFPPVLLAKGLGDLSDATARAEDDGMRWSERTNNSPTLPLQEIYIWLLWDSVFYFFLAWYFDNVVPAEFGVSRPYYFFLTPAYWTGKQGPTKKESTGLNAPPPAEDDDVRAMDDDVQNGRIPPNTAIEIHSLVKKFGFGPNQFVAVNHLSLTVENGTLFCLLGPNGAGKSTTFNMLTGMLSPSAGDATVLGYSIRNSMSKIREMMGVCPQFDILWDELTGLEHMTLFAALRGVPGAEREQMARDRLEAVNLTDALNVPSSSYSGGMRRRLSIAIALIGNPKIVFLDEPTTGMDPIARRQVWNVIEREKKGRVIILTTHSMEEADILSDRIGIVAKGRLRCLGGSLRLKNKFGTGYRITLLGDVPKVKQLFAQYMPDAILETDVAAGYLTYEVPRHATTELGPFFHSLESRSAELGIRDIQLSLTTLEEVFLRIAATVEKHEGGGNPKDADDPIDPLTANADKRSETPLL